MKHLWPDQGTIPEFVQREYGKPRKPLFRIASALAENRNRHWYAIPFGAEVMLIVIG
jgi:hypothetical protein